MAEGARLWVQGVRLRKFKKVQKLMSLIARCMQLTDYQHLPVQWQEKSHVTHVTQKNPKWHQWHVKNKHMSPGSIDTQQVKAPVQWVTCIFKPKKLSPLRRGQGGCFIRMANTPSRKINMRRQNKKTPSRTPQFFFNFCLTLLQELKMFLQL